MKTKFKIGSKVKVSPDNDNEGYNDFRNEVLTVCHVATNTDEHRGYDNSVYPQALYDLKRKNGETVGCSLYDYELVSA